MTYVRLGRTGLELDETNLRLLYPRRATDSGDNILVQYHAVDQLGILDGSADLLDYADIAQVDV